jgi:hypothetical protein
VLCRIVPECSLNDAPMGCVCWNAPHAKSGDDFGLVWCPR